MTKKITKNELFLIFKLKSATSIIHLKQNSVHDVSADLGRYWLNHFLIKPNISRQSTCQKKCNVQTRLVQHPPLGLGHESGTSSNSGQN